MKLKEKQVREEQFIRLKELVKNYDKTSTKDIKSILISVFSKLSYSLLDPKKVSAKNKKIVAKRWDKKDLGSAFASNISKNK